MKQSVKLGLILLVVAGLVTGGIALASDDDAAPSPAAEDDGFRVRAGLRDRLQPLVDDGTISETQADAVAGHLADGARRPTDRPNARRGGNAGAAVADFLGLTPEELHDALADGETLGDVATANGSSPEELVGHLVGLAEARLDEAVANGRLTEDEKAEALARMTEHLTDAVANGRPASPGDGHRGPGHYGDPHHRGPGQRGPGHFGDGRLPGADAPASDAAFNA